jgi:hypothetical protein
MWSRTTSVVALILFCLFLVVSTAAQQPTSTPKKTADNPNVEAGEDAGGYTVTSSLEIGYRGLSVDGDLNKYQSDLNYKAGPRLFDSSLYMKSKDGKGGFLTRFWLRDRLWRGSEWSTPAQYRKAQLVSLRRNVSALQVLQVCQ